MSEKKESRSKKGPSRSFKPMDVATEISLAVKRDLDGIRDDTHPGVRFLAARQQDELLKKFVDPAKDSSVLEAKTLAKFREVNAHMAGFQDMDFPDPTSRIQTNTPYRDKVLLRARALFHHVLGSIDLEELFIACRNSGGVTIGVPYADTSDASKFVWPISCTRSCEPLMNYYLAFDEQLSESVDEFNRHNPFRDRYDIVNGARATTVPKNSDINRFIAVEPTANMFLQQGLMMVMYRRMRPFLDVRSLPYHHMKLAMYASISAQKATIDWRSASDCSAPPLVKWLTPPNWYGLLNMVRSKTLTLKGEELKTNMFSTMGNAGTFPLETLIFWTLGHAVRMSLEPGNTLHPEWADLGEISVFGDDCIVPTNMATEFIEFLSSVGFIVNEEKSFYGEKESFRESCGGDYLSGRNVRPHSMRPPTSMNLSALEPWLYIQLNGLLKKYISCFGSLTYVYDKELLHVVAKWFQRYDLKLKVVPPDYPEDSGLVVNCDLARILACYPFKLATLYVGNHGVVSFNYLRFKYTEKAKRSDDISYALWLRAFTHAERELVEETSEVYARRAMKHLDLPDREERLHSKEREWDSNRKIGGYVVAKGHTSHWDVPC